MFPRRIRRDPGPGSDPMPAREAPMPLRPAADPSALHDACLTLRATYEDRPWFAGVDVGEVADIKVDGKDLGPEPVLILHVQSHRDVHPPGEDLPYAVRVAGEMVPVLVRVAGS